jgi:hypothetical protein
MEVVHILIKGDDVAEELYRRSVAPVCPIHIPLDVWQGTRCNTLARCAEFCAQFVARDTSCNCLLLRERTIP